MWYNFRQPCVDFVDALWVTSNSWLKTLAFLLIYFTLLWRVFLPKYFHMNFKPSILVDLDQLSMKIILYIYICSPTKSNLAAHSNASSQFGKRVQIKYQVWKFVRNLQLFPLLITFEISFTCRNSIRNIFLGLLNVHFEFYFSVVNCANWPDVKVFLFQKSNVK